MTPAPFPFKDLAVIFFGMFGVVLLAFGDLLAVLALFDVQVIDQVPSPEVACGAGRPSSPLPPVADADLAEAGEAGSAKRRPHSPLLAVLQEQRPWDPRAFSGDAAGAGRQHQI